MGNHRKIICVKANDDVNNFVSRLIFFLDKLCNGSFVARSCDEAKSKKKTPAKTGAKNE
jgi:hypothetical protein